ncbi:MAG: 50S ribosomal protein L11 methyltransferase [Legionellales bacterium]
MWFQLKIEHCPSQEIDSFSEELMESGALSIMLTDKNDNPVLEPEPGTTPLWPEVVIQALYAQAIQAQSARDHFAEQRPSFAFSLEVLPDKDWERVCMDDFKPQRFGTRLWICPTWLTPPVPDAINLMLDPGLAFGTGTHPTTAQCLIWLEGANLTNKSLIDYGCGSGILSLAALKLGVDKVYAVDIDGQALQATLNNAQSNNIDTNKLSVSTPEALEQSVDVIIANILLEPLIALKHRFHQLLKPDAVLVVSGLLADQAPILIKAYDSSFNPTAQTLQDGWALLVFTRK